MNFEGAINSAYDLNPLQPVNGFTNFFYVGFTRRINYNFFAERTTGDAETSQALMLPPTSPIAVQSRPSVPGSCARSTSNVAEKAAVGRDIESPGAR